MTEVRWQRHERALEVARRAGADAVLATHVSTVTWLTGAFRCSFFISSSCAEAVNVLPSKL